MKKMLKLFILFLIIFTLVSCEKEEIKIEGPDNVNVGSFISLSINSKSDDIIWESSDNNIASVSDGIVYGISKGNVLIYAYIKDGVYTKEISVNYPVINLSINGINIMNVGSNHLFTFNSSINIDGKYEWSSSNNEVLSVDENGLVTALSKGEAFVILKCFDNESKFLVKVYENLDFDIIIEASNIMNVGDELNLKAYTYPENIDCSFKYSLSDEGIVEIDDNGKVEAIASGNVTIYVSSIEYPNVISSFDIQVLDNKVTGIVLSAKTNLVSGEQSAINAFVESNASDELVWSSSNEDVLLCFNGLVLALREGKSIVRATSLIDKSVYGEIEISVKKYVPLKEKEEDLKRVNDILNNMTLEQKVGQMFMVGFSGTSMSSSLASAIKDYHFGNVIYMGANVSDYNTLSSMSNTIQNEMVKNNGVSAFISIDQEGGTVARIKEGGTHFLSQMAISASANPYNAFLEGSAIAKELLSYGINTDFAPVLDVNNNPDNPVIGIRSYGDNPFSVSLYGTNALKGMKESNLIACPKHFPGHGNTSVDSHYGLPTITASLSELYKVELAPFISAIYSGMDAIMTTHIIFSAIDKDYPATLSDKVLNGLLRKELAYDGIIYTDGMSMNAITKYFGSPDITCVQAVKAGVDILLYTGLSEPKTGYSAIVKAVKDKEISIERINASVRRILLKKLKYGILDNYIIENIDRSEMLEEHEKLNLKFAKESITLAYGSFNGLDKNKSTLIISTECSSTIDSKLESNSFACYASNYLKSKGFSNVSYKTVDKNISTSDASSLLNLASSYEQVVVAFQNVKTSSYTRTGSFVNELAKRKSNLVVISLQTPYDMLAYNDYVNTFICTYGYQRESVIALSMYLNGEFKASGKSPIDESNYR